jgi:diguanylate cyclase (GGDEF)-like protein
MKVLVADDSPTMRKLLQQYLLGWGYEVVCVEDGAQAWAEMERNDAPQIAILDWLMPERTGPEICRLVRQQKREQYTYILLLTSKSQPEDLIEGMNAGADDYVTKPFDRHELQVRVRAGQRIIDLQQQLLKAQEALRRQATHDALTGCWNRAAIMETLHREMSRALRDRHPLGILMIDIDHFKSINDTHGHAAGDMVLREVVNRLHSNIRSYDTLGRYGGEEFLVLLPNCDESGVLRHGERLRHCLEAQLMVCGSAVLTVTASFGAISVIVQDASHPERILRWADEALYRAKRQGRNRVVAISATDPRPEETAAPAALETLGH